MVGRRVASSVGRPVTEEAGRNVVLWFRRDLRVADHPALSAATREARRSGGSVVPLFVLDDRLVRPGGPNRLSYLYECLRELVTDGVPLVVRNGDPAQVVPSVAMEVGAHAVYCSADFAPYGRLRDERVESALSAARRPLIRCGSPYVVDPGVVRKGDGTPFKVFTPFSRAWGQAAGAPNAQFHPDGAGDGAIDGAAGGAIDDCSPNRMTWHRGLAGDAIPPAPSGACRSLVSAGERAAHSRLDQFLERRVDTYDRDRDAPGLDMTSRISADLKFGTLHPRQVLPHLADRGRAGEVFRAELCWREFYADVLWHRPDSARHSLNRAMTAMRLDDGPVADQRFLAWCEGRTGYPIIDAGMRQLSGEGWMHNRVRMLVASFLVKDLHLDWRRGARFFMHHLIDGDIASNQHGWQWAAGTGTDAAPYFRIFNPITQGKKFDPQGTYVRRYVPELRSEPDATIHEPRAGSGRGLFDASGDYPPPIVDHAAERAESLARLAEIRGRA